MATGQVPLGMTLAQLCRDVRIDLDITQRELAASVGVSRAHIASIEAGRANPTLGVVERIAAALGIELELTGRRRMVIIEKRQIDLVHARCSGFVGRRLVAAGWDVRREVTIQTGRTRGWVDLLAYEPRRRMLLVIEIKTSIHDLGAIERQLDWYEREAPRLAARYGWRPVITVAWLLVLESAEVDAVLRLIRDVVDAAFPSRAPAMRRLIADGTWTPGDRGLALLDPRSRQREWLRRTAIEGRRTPAPYRDYAAAAAVMSAGGLRAR